MLCLVSFLANAAPPFPLPRTRRVTSLALPSLFLAFSPVQRLAINTYSVVDVVVANAGVTEIPGWFEDKLDEKSGEPAVSPNPRASRRLASPSSLNLSGVDRRNVNRADSVAFRTLRNLLRRP